MAKSVKDCKDLGAQIGIVIGGGNLFRGEKLSKAGMDRVAGGMDIHTHNALTMRNEKRSTIADIHSVVPDTNKQQAHAQHVHALE